MSAHTPGPWTVRDIPTQGRYIGPANDGGAPSVAFAMSRTSRSEAQLDANARLIAAAPCLLDALRALVSIDDGDCAALYPHADAYEAARAAIAKATGEPA